jgi:hypothetical protein
MILLIRGRVLIATQWVNNLFTAHIIPNLLGIFYVCVTRSVVELKDTSKKNKV